MKHLTQFATGPQPAVARTFPWITLLALWFSLRLAALAADPTTVQLAWNPSPDPAVVGYRVYYGAASGVYTNSLVVGKTNSATITGLVNGTTYYFATTAYTGAGSESSFSNEAVYRVAFSLVQKVSLLTNGRATVSLTGQPGHTYRVEASQSLSSWTSLGTITVGSNGAATFTDVNAANFSRRFYRLRDTTP